MGFNRKYKQNLVIGSVISLSIIFITASASWIAIESLLNSQESVDHTHEVLFGLEKMISRTKDAETGQRGYLLTGNATFLEPYEGAQDEVWESYDRINSLLADNPVQQQSMKQLSHVIKTRFNLLEKSVERKRSGIAIDRRDVQKGQGYMTEFRSIINKMESRERELMKTRTERLSMFSAFTPWLVIFASIAAIIITVVFYYRLTADYKQKLLMEAQLLEKERQISKKINEVQKFAEEVAKGNYKMRINRSDLD